jgi:phage-related protein
MADRPLFWVGDTREDVRAFPPAARRAAGYQLRRVQRGLMPTDWRPVPTVGAGVNEIRIHTGREHRVLYVAKFVGAVHVLHAFEKKTRQIRDADVALARARFKAVEALARRRKER